MLDTLAMIRCSAFPPISFMSKLKWNRLGNCPASDLKFSSSGVIDVEDKDEISYIHQYLFSTSNKTME